MWKSLYVESRASNDLLKVITLKLFDIDLMGSISELLQKASYRKSRQNIMEIMQNNLLLYYSYTYYFSNIYDK